MKRIARAFLVGWAALTAAIVAGLTLGFAVKLFWEATAGLSPLGMAVLTAGLLGSVFALLIGLGLERR